MQRSNPNFMNGVPELLALRLLATREMYGYELVRAIRVQTREALAFGEGCVYPTLHSLEKEGYLASRRNAVNGRERYYYRVTPAGRRQLDKLVKEWERVTQGITTVLGEVHGEPVRA